VSRSSTSTWDSPAPAAAEDVAPVKKNRTVTSPVRSVESNYRRTTVYCETCLSNLQPVNLSCSQCEVRQEGDTLLYCETCFKQIHIDSERIIGKYKRAASAAESKLQVTEYQNEELQRSLYEAKQYITELELKIKNLSQDLDKAYQFHIASGWLKPVLENMAQRLRALEQAEQETESSLATAVQKLDEMKHNGSLWKMLSRHIRPLRR
jgi:septal ring factor EnvC (AmiA/AmiB activator)